MLDRVQLEEDSSNSVSIRGGQRFLVQEGTAKVIPGSFGLTVVEPSYIYVSPLCMFALSSLASLLALGHLHLHSEVFFCGREGYPLHMCNDSNLKSM